MKGTIQEVFNFFKAGEPVNSKSDHSDTPLHYATGYNKGQMVWFLILNGAELESKNEWGATPLFTAIHHKIGTMQNYLLKTVLMLMLH